MKLLKLLLPFVFFLFVFTECKKGEDDPAISLRTRKNRLVGKWKIQSGTYYSKNDQSYVGAGINSLKIIYTDHSKTSTAEMIDISGSTHSSTNETSYSYSLEFKKNGGYTSTMIQGNQSFIISGSWNFTSGVGRNKNKDQVVIHVSSTQGNSGASASVFSGNKTDYTYTLKELRNNKLVITAEDSRIDDSGYNFTSNSELTFRQ